MIMKSALQCLSLPAVSCGELGSVSALRLGPEETGEGTDCSVSSQGDTKEVIIGTVNKACFKYDMHAANKIYTKVHQYINDTVRIRSR